MEYRVFRTSILSNLREVRLYDDTLDHIRDHHPEVPIELPSVTEAVGRAVEMPTHVESSGERHFVFVDSKSTNASGDPLRVPVKLVEGTSGRIQTVYFAQTVTSRNVIWRSE